MIILNGDEKDVHEAGRGREGVTGLGEKKESLKVGLASRISAAQH